MWQDRTTQQEGRNCLHDVVFFHSRFLYFLFTQLMCYWHFKSPINRLSANQLFKSTSTFFTPSLISFGLYLILQ